MIISESYSTARVTCDYAHPCPKSSRIFGAVLSRRALERFGAGTLETQADTISLSFHKASGLIKIWQRGATGEARTGSAYRHVVHEYIELRKIVLSGFE